MFLPPLCHVVASPSGPGRNPTSLRGAGATSIPEGRRALVLGALLASALLAAPHALANKKVFRCEVGGRVIFQQSACGTDAAPPKAAAAPAPNSAASAATVPQRQAASAAAAPAPPALSKSSAPPKPDSPPKRP